MKPTVLDCFACNFTSPPPEGASSPRVLCMEHKARCRVEDGELLSVVMKRAEPTGYPLEGSGLALIYNPVCVDSRTGCRLRGWTDFVAGCMAVFEDRFLVRNRFEFWVLEAGYAGDLLQAIRIHAERNNVVKLAPSDLIALLRAASSPKTGNTGFFSRIKRLVKKEDAGAAVTTASLAKLDNTMSPLWDFWCAQQSLESIRSEVGRQWPDSSDELDTWFHKMMTASAGRDWLVDASAAEFATILQELAMRRIPDIERR